MHEMLAVGLVKSNKDTRYGVAAVVSHDGFKLPCVAVSNLAAFRAHVGEAQYKEVNKQTLF
jgi:thymidine kinase